MKWGLWSVVAASNSATPPDGWPEGQAPSTVNDCAREMMAQIRTGLNNLQFVDLGVTPTETGNTTFTLAGNQMQWYPYGGRVQANVGGTLYAGTVISSTFTTNTGVTLRFDIGQGAILTNSLSAVATGYPAPGGALPEQVFRHANAFINPLMDIWQNTYGPFSLSSGASVYGPDRWLVANHINSAGATLVVSIGERSATLSNVPTLAQAGILINNALVISCNVALTGLSATDNVFIRQTVEGYNWRQLAGKPLTLSFWVNSQVTGTYCVAVGNTNGTLTQIQQYSISSVATWEKKTINLIKSPLTGTWDYSTGAGLICNFTLVAGSSFQGGAGNWTAGNLLATSAQTNFMGAANKTFMMTGVKLEEGNVATPLEPFDISVEYGKCRRYRNVLNSSYLGGAVTNQFGTFEVFYGVPMRAQPTITYPILTQFTVGGFSCSAIATVINDPYHLIVNAAAVGTPLTANQPIEFAVSGTGAIVANADF